MQSRSLGAATRSFMFMLVAIVLVACDGDLAVSNQDDSPVGGGTSQTDAPPSGDVLADGIVDRVEYETAAQSLVDCGQEHGIDIELVPKEDSRSGWTIYGWKTGPGNSAIVDECLVETSWDEIDAARAAQFAPSDEERARAEGDFERCLEENGVDPRDVSSALEGEDDSKIETIDECALSTGYGVSG